MPDDKAARRRRDAEIASLRDAGLSYQQIAEQLSVTIGVVASSVRRQLAEGTLPRHRPRRRTSGQVARDDAAILALRERGMSHHGIAAQLGFTTSMTAAATSRARTRQDLGDDLGLTPGIADELVELRREGLTQAAIAERQHATVWLTSQRIKLLRGRGVDLSARRAPLRWSREAILEALDDWTEEHGHLPSSREWSRAGAEYPSVRTVWKRFKDHGGWAGALRVVAAQRSSSMATPDAVAELDIGRVD